MRHVLLVPLFLALLGSCAPRRALDTHPALVVDSSFTPQEMAQVLGAVHAWEAATPVVTFAVDTEPHDQIAQECTLSPSDDTIYLQRMDDSSGCGCGLDAEWAPADVGLTLFYAYSSASCLNAGLLDADTAQPLIVQAAAAHELGHSLGLWHIDVGIPGHPVSIMTTHHRDAPANALPTSLDVANVLTVHHLTPAPGPGDASP